MAGRESTGFASATPDLFVDRPWVVVPSSSAETVDVERVEALARATGARPVRLSADEHDDVVAAVSHLPLVLAASLVEVVALSPDPAQQWPTARSLAASGWRDMTRLAMGDPEMGAGILATNAAPVAEHLRALRAVLDRWIEDLDEGAPAEAARDRLTAARNALTERP
jgi:prephenate dehydrogenase